MEAAFRSSEMKCSHFHAASAVPEFSLAFLHYPSPKVGGELVQPSGALPMLPSSDKIHGEGETAGLQ